jgi:hypothetical protein
MTSTIKPKLVLLQNCRLSSSSSARGAPADFNRDFYYPTLSNWFDIELYTPSKCYDQGTVFMHNAYHPLSGQLARQHLEQGHRVIFNNVTERKINPAPFEPALAWSLMHPDQTFWLISGNKLSYYPTVRYSEVTFWFWLSEQYVDLYVGYRPQPRREKLFMLLMNRQRSHRTQLWQALNQRTALLEQGVVSFRALGIELLDEPPSPLPHWHDRMLNPDWFDRTAVSLISETDVDEIEGNSPWLTEKTTKALMMQHPFLLQAQPGSLKHLHDHGFETFPELWDEDYDCMPNHYARMHRLLDTLQKFDPNSVNQVRVQQKLQHNRARFWDRRAAGQMFVDQVVHPLLEWINA